MLTLRDLEKNKLLFINTDTIFFDLVDTSLPKMGIL